MPHLQAYHRPESLAEALQLLVREGTNSAVLAGGTQLLARLDPNVDELIDLQAAGMGEVRHDQGRMTLGTMVRVQTIVEDEAAPDLLREMARREGPNTFRNQGTVGGAIALADPESELLAALLVFDAVATVETMAGAHSLSLAQLLPDVGAGLRDGILSGVTLQTTGETAHARVARTPADAPIVAALARRMADGAVKIALCGVAARPILVEPEALRDLTSPGDFRGSSEYRREMAYVLAHRVMDDLS